MQEVGLIKIFTWKHLTLWRPVLLGFSQSTECLISYLHPELLSRGCWRSAACSGHGVSFVQTAGKCQVPVSRVPSQPHIWPCFGGISWPSCPGSNEDSIDRPLCAFTRPELASSKSLDHTCLTSLLAQENIPSCCFFPYLGLQCYSHWSHMQLHVSILSQVSHTFSNIRNNLLKQATWKII